MREHKVTICSPDCKQPDLMVFHVHLNVVHIEGFPHKMSMLWADFVHCDHESICAKQRKQLPLEFHVPLWIKLGTKIMTSTVPSKLTWAVMAHKVSASNSQISIASSWRTKAFPRSIENNGRWEHLFLGLIELDSCSNHFEPWRVFE